MSLNISEVLESLQPHSEAAVMDLVEQAGIDVTPWSVKRDGSLVKNPRANPHYCYEWAFGGDSQPTALCIWHKSLQIADEEICCIDSLRQLALELDRVAIDRTNPTHVKSRARDQAKRARKFDSLLQRAFRKSQPIRVILLFGEDTGKSQVGWETSTVHFRFLDPESWYVHTYNDENGMFRLVRSVPTMVSEGETEIPEEKDSYIDQFANVLAPEKRETSGYAYTRSTDVRQQALQRARGVCEFCGEHGFKMASGAIYLETHHVIPLFALGPDEVWNVVAVCPTDHRRAHYAEDREKISAQLVDKLVATYPSAESALRELLIKYKQT